ncbi:uncharacterized protein LOC131011296 isoform X2 [Salvia miltiorrhiza]|uniref:uncharacterized protein LOC131011296 isoform X2 n=1 Tax=Salvia miltiorrhiza TaxID=226208 RepID=UPI0025AD30F6|nr:uncharacterized protein LOC131011296 isoform X2 [Salvia miltiorrhiza]
MRFKLSFPGGSFETWSENLALASFGGMIPFQNSSSLTTSPAAILLLASLLSILFRNPKNSHHLHNGVVQQYIQQIKHLESEQTSSISKANWVLKEQRSWRQVRDFFGWMKLQNGHVGFMLSCYDAQLSYGSTSDNFVARYKNLLYKNVLSTLAVHGSIEWC